MTSGAWLHRMQRPAPAVRGLELRDREPHVSETLAIQMDSNIRSISSAS
jgi:hypothetical protein